MGVAVTFRHVTKIYQGERAAVRDLCLEVQTGELLVLIGPSGCGKTTTLRMINRLEEPTSGEVWIDGEDVRRLDPVALRRHIGYTIQQTGLFPHMTIRENIDLVPRMLGWPKEKREARIRELLAMVGMDYEEFAHRYPRQLSGGQQQRVGVLRALAADPPLILMDEPFGALDPLMRESLQRELKRLQARLQKTIVFVTHDIDEALTLGDRIAIMKDGVLLQVGTPAELAAHPADPFVENFLGRHGRRPLPRTAADLMLPELPRDTATARPAYPTVPEDLPAGDVVDRLERSTRRLLLVVDASGRPIGSIGDRSIAQALRRLLEASGT